MNIFFLAASLAFCTAAFCTSPHAYITELGKDSVSIVDVNSGSVQKIFGFSSPHTVRVTYDGKFVYVGDDNNNIYKINCLENTVSQVTTLSGHPISLCILPDSSTLYCATNNNNVVIIDLNAQKVLAEIPCLDGPQDIRCTIDGKFVYATNKKNGTISVVNTSTQMLAETLTGFRHPVGITFSLDGKYAYVSESHENLIKVIRLSDNKSIYTILGFNKPSYIAMDPDKNVAYIANQGNNTISVLRISDNFIIDTIQVPNPVAIGVTLDGLFLYVASSLNEILKINILDKSIDMVLPNFQKPSNISLTENNAPTDTVNAWRINADPTNPYNQVTWEKPAGNPYQYRIFRDANYANLLATITASADLSYKDEHLIAGQTYSYYMIADYDNGFSSTIGDITVSPDRIGPATP